MCFFFWYFWAGCGPLALGDVLLVFLIRWLLKAAILAETTQKQNNWQVDKWTKARVSFCASMRH